MRHTAIGTGDHFQILVGDAIRGPAIDTTHLWDDVRGVAAVEGSPQLIAIPTVRYGGKINLMVEVLDAPADTKVFAGCNRIGVFRLEVQSGELLFWGPEAEDLNDAPRIGCKPGTYEGVAYSSGTNLVEDEMMHDGPDRCIQMWQIDS